MFNILISLPYLFTGIFISIFIEYSNWFVLKQTGSSVNVSIYIAFGYLLLSLFIIFFQKVTIFFPKKNLLVLFNILALLFLAVISSSTNLIILFICYIFFIIYRYIEQSCRFAYYKNMLKDNNKYSFASFLLEFNRQSITLIAGIIFIFLGYIVNLHLIGVLGFCLLIISLIMNISLEKDLKPTEVEVTQYKDVFGHSYKEILPIFILSIPYVMNISITVSLPAYFSEIGSGQLYYLVSLVPYGIGAILGSFFYFKKFHNIIISLVICFVMFVIACIYPNISNAYILQLLMAFTNSATRIYRNTSIMKNYSKLLAQTIFNKTEFLCIICIFFNFNYVWYNY